MNFEKQRLVTTRRNFHLFWTWHSRSKGWNGPEMILHRFPQPLAVDKTRKDPCQTLKDGRRYTTTVTGFYVTPCSRAWLTPSVAMMYPLLIAIAEGSSK